MDVVVDKQAMRILTINSGSSSLKFGLFQMGRAQTLKLSGSLERIGLAAGVFHVKDGDGQSLIEQRLPLPDHDAALTRLLGWLESEPVGRALEAVGHRVVHGGIQYTRAHFVTPAVLASLRRLVPLAPDHMPHELKAIEAISRRYSSLPQVACFDTAFHRSMPALAQAYALPRELRQDDILRYGFHGLSYEYIMNELRREAGPDAADGRVIIAHLGNGASMAAVRHGRSVDTTMGFTPTGGLVMSTRSGDLDPGIIIYLLHEKGLSPSDVNDIVTQRAGLLGVSGFSSDMRDLLAKEAENRSAAEAVGLFCYQAKKFLASLAAVLGGLDTLIFTAGIGENAPAVRWRICQDLAFLGVRVDRSRNDANAPVISPDGSPVTVRVMKTNEELIIARHTENLVRDRLSGGTEPA